MTDRNRGSEQQDVKRRTPGGPGRRVLLNRFRRPGRTGRRILVSTATLPALFTVMNALAGFASIHFATKDTLGEAKPINLAVGAWLVFAGMLFDMLDGRIARITRKASEFGEQLDSLCDVITFGVAPAVLMVRTVTMVLRGQIERIEILSGGLAIERIVLCVAGIYLACAALRLARFNVETDPGETAHMSFRGLPSPGAAAAITAMVLLFVDLVSWEEGWRSSTWILATVSITLPVLTLLVALLMVSRFEYPHLVNQYIRSKKSFGFLVKLVLLLPAAILVFYVTAAGLAVGYALSGPTRIVWNRLRKKRPPRGSEQQIAT